MNLVKPTDEHLFEITQWFSIQAELVDWSGSALNYPLSVSHLTAELNIHVVDSFVLLSDEMEVLAFGQFYLRLNKCHLARLIVNPVYRGNGIAAKLIDQLAQIGCKQLNVNGVSLFVLAHNQSAISAYKKYGFIESSYPEPLLEANCLYMIRK